MQPLGGYIPVLCIKLGKERRSLRGCIHITAIRASVTFIFFRKGSR